MDIVNKESLGIKMNIDEIALTESLNRMDALVFNETFRELLIQLGENLYKDKFFYTLAKDFEVDFTFNHEGFTALAKKLKVDAKDLFALLKDADNKRSSSFVLLLLTFFRVVECEHISPVDDKDLFAEQFAESIVFAIQKGKKKLYKNLNE